MKNVKNVKKREKKLIIVNIIHKDIYTYSGIKLSKNIIFIFIETSTDDTLNLKKYDHECIT